MKKNILLIIMVGMLFLTGCNKKTDVDTEGKLLSEEYAEIFKEEIKNDKDILLKLFLRMKILNLKQKLMNYLKMITYQDLIMK